MGDGLKKVFAYVKHGQQDAPDPPTPVQRRVLADAVRGNAFVVPKERRSARALEVRELVTIAKSYRSYTKRRADGTSYTTTFEDWHATATPAGKAVHEAIEKRR